MTKEHLIPGWLLRVLGEFNAAGDGFVQSFAFTNRTEPEAKRSHGSADLGVVIKAVCATCNNGWMATLEAECQPLVTALVRAERVALPVPAQMRIAWWFAKTAALMDRYHGDSVVLGEHDLDEIYLNKSAPSTWLIRLALRESVDEVPVNMYVSTAHVIPADAAERSTGEPNSFLATFALGHLVLSAAGGPGFARPERWRSGSDFPMTIWPPTPKGLRWPPAAPRLRDRAEFLDFHEGLYARVLNPEFQRPDALSVESAPGGD